MLQGETRQSKACKLAPEIGFVPDAAGGHWPETARAACTELVKVAVSREASLGVKLLTDLRDVFGNDEVLSTETVLERLNALEESPWANFRGKPLDPRGLARRLNQYEVSSTKVKIGNASVRGYRREHLWDAWERYVAPNSGDMEPPEPLEPTRSEDSLLVPDLVAVPEPGWQAEPKALVLSRDVPLVPDVRDFPSRERWQT